MSISRLGKNEVSSIADACHKYFTFVFPDGLQGEDADDQCNNTCQQAPVDEGNINLTCSFIGGVQCFHVGCVAELNGLAGASVQ